MDEPLPCKLDPPGQPEIVKRSNNCIGRDDPISLEVLDESDDPLCLNGKCYSFKSLKNSLIRHPRDPISRRPVRDPENILGLQTDHNNVIIRQINQPAAPDPEPVRMHIVRTNHNEQEARELAIQLRQETEDNLRSEPLPTNKQDKMRELMRRVYETKKLDLELESLIRNAIETDDAVYANQLQAAGYDDAEIQGLLRLGHQTTGGKLKKTRRKKHRKNKMTKRLKKKHKKTRKK